MVIHRVHHHLHVALGLHEGPHHAERTHRRPFLHQEAGDDGVVRLLAAGQAVIAALIQGEVGPRFWRQIPVPGMRMPAPKVV